MALLLYTHILISILQLPLSWQEFCSNTVKIANETPGSIQSPNYPETYPNDVDCIFIIKANKDQSIWLNFEYVDLESGGCSYDYLEVRDGDSQASPLLKKFCSYGSSSDDNVFISSGRALSIKFHTDSVIGRSGYFARYAAFEKGWTPLYLDATEHGTKTYATTDFNPRKDVIQISLTDGIESRSISNMTLNLVLGVDLYAGYRKVARLVLSYKVQTSAVGEITKRYGYLDLKLYYFYVNCPDPVNDQYVQLHGNADQKKQIIFDMTSYEVGTIDGTGVLYYKCQQKKVFRDYWMKVMRGEERIIQKMNMDIRMGSSSSTYLAKLVSLRYRITEKTEEIAHFQKSTVLIFPKPPEKTNYVSINKLELDSGMAAVSVSQWVYYDGRYGLSRWWLSYAVPSCMNALTIGDGAYGSGVTVHINCYRYSHSINPVILDERVWHHIVVTWDSGDLSLDMFINGTNVYTTSTAASSGKPIENGGSLVLGQEQDTLGGGFANNQAFSGKLLQLNLFNTKLTADDVNRVYDGGIGGEIPADLIGSVILGWDRIVTQELHGYCSLESDNEIQKGDLLSQNRQTSSNSVSYGGVSDRAVDGDTSGTWADKTCTRSYGGTNNWWKVDLEATAKVYTIKIYNRLDCCEDRINGAQVFVGNVLCERIIYVAGQAEYVLDCGGMVGDSVKVVQSYDFLTLCEVKVYGELEDNTTATSAKSDSYTTHYPPSRSDSSSGSTKAIICVSVALAISVLCTFCCYRICRKKDQPTVAEQRPAMNTYTPVTAQDDANIQDENHGYSTNVVLSPNRTTLSSETEPTGPAAPTLATQAPPTYDNLDSTFEVEQAGPSYPEINSEVSAPLVLPPSAPIGEDDTGREPSVLSPRDPPPPTYEELFGNTEC